ncbi:SDR family oxidoreductase [Nocardia transvalensis]|nr:SDR family oxidoreductase [Nocardia transvalensis]MBF6331140.1 SDR family oxidoreductase [Nocardia transvalensis]
MTIVVTGATGSVGRLVVRPLLDCRPTDHAMHFGGELR